MINALFHYLTLPYRTRNRIRRCANIVSAISEDNSDINTTIEKLIKNGEIGQAVDYLERKGEIENLSDREFWSELHTVAKDHKMKEKVILFENKLQNLNKSS